MINVNKIFCNFSVKPDPPTDVYIVDNNVTTGDTKSSVVVSWQPPDKNTLLDLSYAIRRRKSNRADSWKVKQKC